MAELVYARALRRAADILGSVEALRIRLNVSSFALENWIGGKTEPPGLVFLAAVDIIIEAKLRETRLLGKARPSEGLTPPKD